MKQKECLLAALLSGIYRQREKVCKPLTDVSSCSVWDGD